MTSIQSQIEEYPKLLSFAFMCVIAYVLHHVGAFDHFPHVFRGEGYITSFVGGLLFSFGFTTPIAIALFISIAPDVHPIPAALLAGFGSMIVDVSILKFARFSLAQELHHLKTTRLLQHVIHVFHHPSLSDRVRQYILWSFAGLVIVSPLPDEIGITLLGGTTDVSSKKVAAFCFVLNTIGIFAVLSIAAIVQSS